MESREIRIVRMNRSIPVNSNHTVSSAISYKTVHVRIKSDDQWLFQFVTMVLVTRVNLTKADCFDRKLRTICRKNFRIELTIMIRI